MKIKALSILIIFISCVFIYSISFKQEQVVELDTTNSFNSTTSIEYKLTSYTNKYPHGAFGTDALPTEIVLLNGKQEKSIVKLADNQVFETSRIIEDDIVGDDTAELLLTKSDQNLGAANVIYSDSGEELASSDYIGTRFRWRHLLGLIKNQNDDKFIIDIVTPHLSGELSLYKVIDDKIILFDSVPGYASHQFGSDNLDLAKIELVSGEDVISVPTFDGDIHQFKVIDEKLVRLE